MKNLQKIKLALTVGMINKSEKGNTIATIKEMMRNFKTEVGNFIGLTITNRIPLGASMKNQIFAIKYENAVLNVNVVTNTNTRSQYIQGFDLR